MVTMMFGDKEITITPDSVATEFIEIRILDTDKGKRAKKTIILTLCRAEALTLATAVKESVPKR